MRSKASVIVILGLLVVMTGIFTASSADNGGLVAAGDDADDFILVNGDEISEREFLSRVATIEQNLISLSAQAEMVAGEDPFVESLMQIMDVTSAETIALASLILDVAIYQVAVERGFQAHAPAIEAQVEEDRETFEMIEEDPAAYGVDESAVSNYRETIDEVGEERYWSEYYPQMLEQQAAVQGFQATVDQDDGDWIQIQREAFQSAEIEVRDSNAIAPATVSAAADYLNAIWELTAEQDRGN